MKKLSKISVKSSLLFLIIVFVLVSCSNSESKNNETQNNKTQSEEITNNDKTPAVNATIDGNVWESSSLGTYSPVEAVALINSSQNINIQTYGVDGSYISLNVLSTSAIKENTVYTSVSGFFQAQYKPDFMEIASFMSVIGDGTISFSNISNTYLEGKFSFNGVNPSGGSILVENGTFNIKL